MNDTLYLTFDDICRNIKLIKHQIHNSNKKYDAILTISGR